MRGRTPTPRVPPKRPGDLATALFCLLMLGLLALALWCGLSGAVGTDALRAGNPRGVAHDSLAPTYTSDGEVIRWYVLVDPDTGVEYLMNDRGGCCARLGDDGSAMGVRDE